MNTAVAIQQPIDLTLHIENIHILPSLKRILKALPGIKVVQHRRSSNVITPALQRTIDKARREHAEGKGLTFHSAKEAQEWMNAL